MNVLSYNTSQMLLLMIFVSKRLRSDWRCAFRRRLFQAGPQLTSPVAIVHTQFLKHILSQILPLVEIPSILTSSEKSICKCSLHITVNTSSLIKHTCLNHFILINIFVQAYRFCMSASFGQP